MLHVDIQFSPFVEEAVLSPLNILAPLLQITGGCMWLSIPGFSSLFYMSVFMPVAHCFDYRSCEGPSCVDQSWQCVSAQAGETGALTLEPGKPALRRDGLEGEPAAPYDHPQTKLLVKEAPAGDLTATISLWS